MDRALLAAIASPRRREILRLLWTEERSVGEIHGAMPDVTLGAVSLQLKALAGAGLIESRADRQQRFYRVCSHRVEPVAAMLEQMWDDRLWHLKLAAELEETRRGPRPAGLVNRKQAKNLKNRKHPKHLKNAKHPERGRS